jgi:SsrA-binding protein
VSHPPANKTSKPKVIKPITQNRRATFDFHIEKRIEAGIQLTGSEVKSCRDSKVQLVDSYAMIEKGEMYLHKAHITEYSKGSPYFNHVPVRKRKLLLHKREIKNLRESVEQQGYTIIPLSMYFKGGVAKVELGLAKGKNKGDKRAATAEKEVARNLSRVVRRGAARSSSSYDDE